MRYCSATLLVLLMGVGSAQADDWRLVWSDDFDKPGMPDESKWTYEEGFIRNHESQYYTRARKENARVEDGALVIEARKERFKNPRRGPEFAEYTSASVNTRGKVAWCYGRIEVRAKLPTGRGMWPAIWMLGTSIDKVGWPACGEIDIMENVGYDPDMIHANIHTKAYNHVKGTGKGSKLTVPKPHEDFHVYAVEWTEKRMDFFVDDQKYFSFDNEGSGRDAWPYDQPHYLILNIAVGGAWGGQRGINDDIFPQKMLVDYVRVYEKAK
jgi:beta-glucanase (GH16 family)